MKVIILAAGYATRLYPLTENYPKPLLKVGDITIVDRLIKDISQIEDVNEIVVVSNDKFISHFKKWQENILTKTDIRITLLNDASTDNDNRLGAVKDIIFATDMLDIKDDILVMAGDNVLDFSLVDFYEYAKDKNTSCIMYHVEKDINKLKKTGVITIDENSKVTSMEEKPQEPKSNYAVPPFYYYVEKDLEKIRECVKAGCKTDAPGNLLKILCKETTIHAYKMQGNRYDIGDIESYKKACEIFESKIKK